VKNSTLTVKNMPVPVASTRETNAYLRNGPAGKQGTGPCPDHRKTRHPGHGISRSCRGPFAMTSHRRDTRNHRPFGTKRFDCRRRLNTGIWDLGDVDTLPDFGSRKGRSRLDLLRTLHQIPYGHIWLGGPGRGQACARGVLGEAIGRPVERRYSLTRRTFQIGA
jgi:hypothetical protein